MITLKKDDRVMHNYLGKATIIKVIASEITNSVVAYLIFTDKTPDVRYNMGNPNCLVYPGDLMGIND